MVSRKVPRKPEKKGVHLEEQWEERRGFYGRLTYGGPGSSRRVLPERTCRKDFKVTEFLRDRVGRRIKRGIVNRRFHVLVHKQIEKITETEGDLNE